MFTVSISTGAVLDADLAFTPLPINEVRPHTKENMIEQLPKLSGRILVAEDGR